MPATIDYAYFFGQLISLLVLPALLTIAVIFLLRNFARTKNKDVWGSAILVMIADAFVIWGALASIHFTI